MPPNIQEMVESWLTDKPHLLAEAEWITAHMRAAWDLGVAVGESRKDNDARRDRLAVIGEEAIVALGLDFEYDAPIDIKGEIDYLRDSADTLSEAAEKAE